MKRELVRDEAGQVLISGRPDFIPPRVQTCSLEIASDSDCGRITDHPEVILKS
jgi:hypothetical protein